MSDEDTKTLLHSHPDLSSGTTSVAQSNEYLHEVGGGYIVTSQPGTAGNGTTADANAGGLVVMVEGEEGAVFEDTNCAMLCLDGEQPCDVGSCCTVPVKR